MAPRFGRCPAGRGRVGAPRRPAGSPMAPRFVRWMTGDERRQRTGRARRHRAALRLAPGRAARPADPRPDRGRHLLRAALDLARPGRPLRPARRAAGRAPAQGQHDDRDQRDLAVPGAAEDHPDGRVPARPCRSCSTRSWAFVAPGLYTHEKKLVLPLVDLEHGPVLRRRRVLLLLRLRQGLHLHPVASRRRASRPRRTSRPTSASC